MSFLSHSSYPCHCPFCHHPSDVLLLILSPIWPFLNLLTNLAFLKTISLSFKLSSVIPTSGISFGRQPKCHNFLHESSIICPVRYRLCLLKSHNQDLSCAYEYAFQVYIMSSVLHTNLSNIYLTFPLG